MNKVLEMIISLAEQKAGKEQLNIYHLLYSYTQLLSMKSAMLDNLFSSEDSKKDLNEIRRLAQVRNLDIDMMKKGVSLILSSSLKDESSVIIHSEEKDRLKERSASEVFKELLDRKEIPIDSFGNGCTLEDILKLKNELTIQQQAEVSPEPTVIRQSDDKSSQPALSSCPKESDDTRPSADTEQTPAHPTQNNKHSLETLTLNTKDLYYKLKQTIIGQDDAVDTFIRGFFKSELFSGIKRSDNKPAATFLFVGPPGVGKTLLATEAARILERPCLRLNMSEYSDHQSATDLIGVSKSFAQATNGKLTSFVASYPASVVIFDEIEKAHLNVVQLFLQILDAGILQDAMDQKNVSFKDTVLIFTTNAGKALYEESRDKNLSHLDSITILDALEKEEHPTRPGPLFPAAICSRFTSGNVIMFNYLNARYLQEIVKMNFDKCIRMFHEKYSWDISYDEQIPTLFLYHQGARMDARIISAKSYQFIQDEIYEYARQAVASVPLDHLRQFTFTMNTDMADHEIQRLFTNESTPEVLIFGEKEAVSPGIHSIGNGVVIHRANRLEELRELLANKDISFVIVDPDYGAGADADYGFSLDDIGSLGMVAFHTLREEMPQVPLYILDKGERLRDVDRLTFMRQGASGFITHDPANTDVITEEILKVSAVDYLQERISELGSRGKHLAFNTAQKINDDKTQAIIEFYDFKLYTAVNADDQGIVLDALERPKVGFSDVIGAENAVQELRYFVDFLKDPKKYVLNGAKPPKGILLYGPPGTGKTLLARAMAGEADATFFAANATDFISKWVGEGEKHVRQLFAAARRYAPSIIFIDEIDAIAKERTGESHLETYLNTLMTEMDGFKFDVKKPVFVLAATNFPLERSKAGGGAIIDPALLRRFDNRIQVDLPNKEERTAFLKLQFSKIKNAEVDDETIQNIADRTTGESLANLQNILNLAVRNSDRESKVLSSNLLLDAMEEFFYGEKNEWNEEYYCSVAHHEAGHAYVTWLSGKTPSFVTIVSRGDFGGYMQHSSDEDIPSYTKEQLLWRIRIALAGRASEIVFFGKDEGTNTGVSGDLQNATNLALNMICKYGMAEDTLLSLDIKQILDTPMGERILKEAESILKQEMEKTIELIQNGKEKIELLSQKLMEKNQLVGEEIKAMLTE